jgi:hypothetical protein
MLGGRLTLDQIEAVQKAIKAGEDPTAVLGEALESERDILRDIRSLLSGGNDEFLHESRRAASIANENIDNGAQLKDALESIQDVLREFITQNIDTVRTVLTELATFMEEMRPVLRAISMALSDLVKFFSDSEPRAAVSTTKTAKDLEAPQVENMRRAQQQFLATRALTQDPELAYQGLITDYAAILENPATAHGIATTFEAGGATQGPLPVSDVERTVLSTLDRFARERGFDPAAHGGSGATDTRAEMQAMMSYVVGTLQFAVPSSVRAIVDRTGGPQ